MLRFAKTPEAIRAACERRIEELERIVRDGKGFDWERVEEQQAQLRVIRAHIDDVVIDDARWEPDFRAAGAEREPVVHLTFAELRFLFEPRGAEE